MDNYLSKVAVIIPAYEPDDKLVTLMEKLVQNNIEKILLVDDGSGPKYKGIFDKAREIGDCKLFVHAVNLGKGRALKDAFNYCLNEWPDIAGVVTADSDGQHTPEDIIKIMQTVYDNPEDLIMGVRDFTGSNIPVRSSFGNKTTSIVFRLLMGLKVSDTQTGLRGIGTSFMKVLMAVSGERYEFETNMLLETKSRGIKITEVPIATIYIENNATSHFRPLRDSIRIYVLFLKYIMSSGASSIVDLGLFTLACALLRQRFSSVNYVLIATVLARIVSAVFNYFINLRVVFASKATVKSTAWKYALLAVFQMCASGMLVRLLYPLFGGLEVFVKIPVDIVLFLFSYVIQREVVYRNK